VAFPDLLKHPHCTGFREECERFATFQAKPPVARDLPLLSRKMTSTPALLSVLALLVVATPRALTAETPVDDAHRHVRTTDRRLHRLLHEGLRTSDTFRGLVDRLHQSDVVVYLECGGPSTPGGGRLTFVSAVGGYRYVHVRVSLLMSTDQQLAIIGHELRHAVEIADAPDVVDGPSMAVAYQRIGYAKPRTMGLAFDSDAAIEAGYRVLRDLSGASGD